MTRRGVFGFVLAGVLSLGGCDAEPETMRYKMTVEVETPQGLKTGFAVRELTYHANDSGWFPLGESRPSLSMQGEAVVIDLALGQTLFALLSGGSGEVDYTKMVPNRALGTPLATERERPKNGRQSAELWPNHINTIGLMNSNQLPMLVRFGDIGDPKSVEEVKPDALDKAFGPGVRLKRISIAVTYEAVTSRIGKRLSWLNHLDNYLSDRGNPFTSTLPREIGGFRSTDK